MSHHASPQPDQTEPGATRDVIPYRVADLSRKRIQRRPVLGGLINEYERAA
jgi:hypothetical protein